MNEILFYTGALVFIIDGFYKIFEKEKPFPIGRPKEIFIKTLKKPSTWVSVFEAIWLTNGLCYEYWFCFVAFILFNMLSMLKLDYLPNRAKMKSILFIVSEIIICGFMVGHHLVKSYS